MLDGCGREVGVRGRRNAVEFDLGLQGLGILAACGLGFGAVAQIFAWSTTRWMWLAVALGWFVGGLFVSEVLFATATEGEIQPIIDGLAFDESLLGGVIGGTLAGVATWFAARGGILHGPTSV